VDAAELERSGQAEPVFPVALDRLDVDVGKPRAELIVRPPKQPEDGVGVIMPLADVRGAGPKLSLIARLLSPPPTCSGLASLVQERSHRLGLQPRWPIIRQRMINATADMGRQDLTGPATIPR
jgi:hypothetical protein